MSYRTVLGFEVHVELATNSKMFCGCPADHFGKPPNSQTCPVCLGLPGALPVPNQKAIVWCIKLGLALNCQINPLAKFDRKHYFYPDLPKGYQISQYDQPLCHHGYLALSSEKKIGITRVHLEEDTGKLLHLPSETWIDFNRSGVPLVEIVTDPDFADSAESDEFLKEIQAIVRTLEISAADMEKGSMRLEANVSLASEGSTSLPDYKVEIKNVNSFRFIKKAIDFEIQRQAQLLDSGLTPIQETRGWSEAKGETVSQRGKEEAHDYRYFPEPDIPTLEFSLQQVEKWRKQLPELPVAKRNKLVTKYGLSLGQATVLVASNRRYQRFMEQVEDHDPTKVAKMLVNLPEEQVSDASIDRYIDISNKNTDEIRNAVGKVVAANPKAVADYKSGKSQALFYLIGQVKKKLGEVNIPLTHRIIGEIIS